VGEFDDLDPAEFAKSVDQPRARLQQEQAGTAIKELDGNRDRDGNWDVSCPRTKIGVGDPSAYLLC
jgi:hypothetical protein